MATVIQGGRVDDTVGQALRQNNQLWQQSRQLDQQQEQQNRADAAKGAVGIMDQIKGLQSYQNDPEAFWAKNPKILGQVTSLISRASGRALTGQQATDLAGQLSAYAEQNPTPVEKKYRGYNAGIPTDASQAQQGQSGTSSSTASAAAAPAAAPSEAAAAAPAAVDPHAGMIRIPAGVAPAQVFGTLAGMTGDVAGAQNLAAAHQLDLQPADQDRWVQPNLQAFAQTSQAKMQRGLPGFDVNALAQQQGWVLPTQQQSAVTNLQKAQAILQNPNSTEQAKKLAALVIQGSQAAKATGSPARNEGHMSAAALKRHEAATGDVHYPAMIGTKEGIVNANAMQHGGQAVVQALNDKYPVYADGKSSMDAAPPDTSDSLLQLLQQRSTQSAQAADNTFASAHPETSAVRTPNSQIVVSDPNGTGLLVQPDSNDLDPGDLGAEDQQYLQQQSAKRSAQITSQAQSEADKLVADAQKRSRAAQGAAMLASARAGIAGVKARLAQMPVDFGNAIQNAVMASGGEASQSYKDKVLAKRDAMYLGKYTKEELDALPLDQRQEIAHKMDTYMQSFSPEFLASASGEKSTDISAQRGASENRKLQLLLAKVEAMKQTNVGMAQLLTPMTTAMDKIGNLIQISQSEARAAKKPLAEYWKLDGKGMLDQINSMSSLVETFGKELGVNLNLQMLIQNHQWGLFGLNNSATIQSAGGAGAASAGTGTLSDADQQAAAKFLSTHK